VKKFAIILAIIMFVSFISAFVVFAATGFRFNAVNNNVDDNKTESPAGIQKINISSLSSEVNIIPTDSNEIKAHLYGTTSVSKNEDKPRLEILKNENSLDMKVIFPNRMIWFGFIFNNIKLDVDIPKAYLNDLNVHTTSGKINIKDISLNELNISKISGDFDGNNLTAKSVHLSSISGSSRLEGKLGDLDINSTSGDVRATYTEFDNDVTVTSVSGRVVLKLPDNAQFKLRSKAVSGNVSCDFALSDKNSGHNFLDGIAGVGGKTISINSTSGDIEIRK
jgi:lia operon protein LiaG